MAANKEAIAIVLDVGPSMNQAPPGEETSLQTSIEAITMILQRKISADSKDEVALVLFGTRDTDNPLADDESYANISIVRPLGVTDFDLLKFVKNDIQPGTTSADFLDAIVVAMDHLMNGIQGKKGFGCKRLIIMSDVGGEFGDDQIDTIIAGINNSETELNVIGPNLDDEDDDEPKAGPSSASNSHRKAKTAQQRAGEAMIRHLVDQVNGDCYSFSEVLPFLAHFQTRKIRPTAWKCPLEITSQLQIPICGYKKVDEFKTKSWKNVYARDPDQAIEKLRTLHKNDEDETEVDKEDVVEGQRYGNTLVPMTQDDKKNMKYESEKCFKVLGFTDARNVKRHHLMSGGVMVIVAEIGDETAEVALSAVINAMDEEDMVMIVRRVYNRASAPKVGCLIPNVKDDKECLYYIELPFSEDIRQFTFAPLPMEGVSSGSKHKPTAGQLNVIDDLITNMDLTQAVKDESDEAVEVLKPKLTFNPFIQRLYQSLLHRGLHPNDTLPELPPMIASCLEPPQEVSTSCQDTIETIKKKFKLEVVKKKEQKTGEDIFKDNEAGDGDPSAKRLKIDENLEGGMETITKAKVTKVGTTTPVEDFLSMINRKDEDLFEDAGHQMERRIEQIVTDSFGDQFYQKAIDCLKVLRRECKSKCEPGLYNAFIQQFKDTLIAKARRDFLQLIFTEKLGLISKLESEDSAVSAEEAKLFYTGEEEEKEEKPAADEDSDDLLGEL